MKKTLLFLTLLATASLLYVGCCPKPNCPCPCPPNCERFEALSLNQQYGKIGGVVVNPPGSVVFSAIGGVPTRIQRLEYPSGSNGFEFARVEAAPVTFGSGQVVTTNNVGLDFDFSGKNVKEVSIEFLDLGGSENIFVNGTQALIGEIGTFGPITVAGVQVIVVGLTTVPGGQKGKITVRHITTDVLTFRVGGQEFYLDNLCYQQ